MQLNRRAFFGFLGKGAGAAVVSTSPILKYLMKLVPEPIANTIGGWVSYRFKFTVLPPPDSSRLKEKLRRIMKEDVC